MGKIIAVLALMTLMLSLLASCGKALSADELMAEFLYSYPAEGTVYSPTVPEGEAGYVGDGIAEKIYVFEGAFPENYAIFLNSHTDYGAECGVFVCRDEDERARVTDMCEERIALLGRGKDIGFIARSGNVVFYSTLKDRAAAERLWRKIIESHT